jgi:Carboxypeptidase regulatory-like domain/TonB dependent receptor-like, beta-barrel
MKFVFEHIWARIFLAVLLLGLVSTGAWAQASAQISGTVIDQTAARLPGVEVTLTQTATGLVRTAVTDETGSYVITNLPVGPYRLEAALAGFRTYVQTGIVLQVGSNPVFNSVLEVGQVADTVEVQADAVMVETRSTGVGQVIDNVRVLELPLNGRQAVELVLLSGAAIGGGNQGTNRNFPTEAISVAGGRNEGLTYQLDGGNHNDPFNNLNLPLPFPDALQEFKVETSSLTAQYGLHSAGSVRAVTKSGTNELHGDLFEFVRNKVFNARNAFARERDGLKRNQFGGVVGGPILKDKLFFFAGYQRTTVRSEPSTFFAYIPTPAMLAGDWTAITSPACNASRQITLRAPFVNNRIDPSLYSRPSLNLVKRLPVTNDPCGQVQFGRAANGDNDLIVGKIDFQKSAKHSLFGRYQGALSFEPTDYDGVNLLSASNADYDRSALSLVIGDTYLIGNSTVNSFRGTINRTRNVKDTEDYFTATDLGVKNFTYPDGYAKLLNLGVAGGFSIYSAPGNPGFLNSTILEVADDLSFVRGRHQVAFGANLLHVKMNVKGGTQAPGSFDFTATNTGMGLGDFMLGMLNRFRQAAIDSYHYRQNSVAAFVQDSWKATNRLTVNAGVRWEPFLYPWDKRGRVVYFDKSNYDENIRSNIFKNAPVGLKFPGDPGIDSNSIGPNAWWRFAPRLGLALDPTGKGRMTVRASYGLFFDYPNLYAYGDMRKNPPWGYSISISRPPGGFEDPYQGLPGGNPFPVLITPDVAFPISGRYVYSRTEQKPPYTNAWNLSIQRQFGDDWMVAANYLGNNIIHMMNGYATNPVVYVPGASCVIAGRTYSPCSTTSNAAQRRQLYLNDPVKGQWYDEMIYIGDEGTRSYHGLWLQAQRRRSRGVTIQTNYTWGHCIEDPTNDTNLGHAATIRDRRRADRGNCMQDRRHNFNMSAVYDMPQFSNTTLRILGSGWKISGIVRVLSGSQLSVLSGIDRALQDGEQRPNQVLPDVYMPNKTYNQWLNPAAFEQPALGTFGNMGTFNVKGPGKFTINMGLTRIFQIREKQSLEFRAEAFNLPNRLNAGDPSTTLSDANFGRILSADDPRIMQFAFKYVF